MISNRNQKRTKSTKQKHETPQGFWQKKARTPGPPALVNLSISKRPYRIAFNQIKKLNNEMLFKKIFCPTKKAAQLKNPHFAKLFNSKNLMTKCYWSQKHFRT